MEPSALSNCRCSKVLPALLALIRKSRPMPALFSCAAIGTLTLCSILTLPMASSVRPWLFYDSTSSLSSALSSILSYLVVVTDLLSICTPFSACGPPANPLFFLVSNLLSMTTLLLESTGVSQLPSDYFIDYFFDSIHDALF